MTFTLGPFEFDYTDEALRVLPKVETRLRRELIDETDEVYGRRYRRYGEASSDERVTRTEMGDGEPRRNEVEREKSDTEEPREAASAEIRSLEKEIESLRSRVEDLEGEKEQLRRRLKEERERKKELREEMEKKDTESETDSYSAEDWLG